MRRRKTVKLIEHSKKPTKKSHRGFYGFYRKFSNKPLKKPFFSRARLAGFAIIFSVIGGYTIYKGFTAEPCSSVSQYGITFEFNKAYQCGQFANGDYWVAPVSGETNVVITRITPEYTNGRNGWEVNPDVSSNDKQAFDSRIGNGVDTNLLPALPYSATGRKSIVKAVSADPDSACGRNRSCLQTAAVLTVVETPPPGNGVDVFRPPYIGTSKPYYYQNQLQTHLLPSNPYVANKVSLDQTLESFRRVKLDHLGGGFARQIRPIDSLPNYGGDNARHTGDGALSLMLEDPLSTKMPALTAYLQSGIDWYHILERGETWPDGAGHDHGHKLPIVFAATLLNDQAMKAKIPTAVLHEDRYLQIGNGNKVLYGSTGTPELNYWQTLNNNSSGAKSQADPYGYIDGGNLPTSSYQYGSVSKPYKGIAIAFHIMPSMKQVWNGQTLFDYVDRWVASGHWTQPDPCAPPIYGDPSFSVNYGVKYGPDGQGSCIKDNDPSDGIGRFPELHGTRKDGGNRNSLFQASMWNAYRNTSSTSPPATPPTSPTTPPPSNTTPPQPPTSSPAKPGDLNNSGKVDILDLSILLSKYGTNSSIGDLNSSGKVDILDLSILLSKYGG